MAKDTNPPNQTTTNNKKVFQTPQVYLLQRAKARKRTFQGTGKQPKQFHSLIWTWSKRCQSICKLTNFNSESAGAARDTFCMTTSNNQTANPATLKFAAICAANAVANLAVLLGVSELRWRQIKDSTQF